MLNECLWWSYADDYVTLIVIWCYTDDDVILIVMVMLH